MSQQIANWVSVVDRHVQDWPGFLRAQSSTSETCSTWSRASRRTLGVPGSRPCLRLNSCCTWWTRARAPDQVGRAADCAGLDS